MTFLFGEALGRIKMLFHLQSLVGIQKGDKVVMYDGNVTTDERDSCLPVHTHIHIHLFSIPEIQQSGYRACQ
jgi:hypothetical protein